MKAVLASSIAALLAAGGLHAQSSVQITGFGQVVAGTVTSGSSHPGTNYDRDWDFKDESLFAIQFRGDLNTQWSATAQIVATGREDFEPEFAWAYVGWNGGNGWSAKLGRQRIPFYRYSDFLQVGYAYPWLRPPHAVYNLPFSNFDGGSLSWSFAGGEWFNTLSLVGGKHNGDITLSGQPAEIELKGLVGLTYEGSYADWLTLRAGYFEADVTIDAQALNPLFATLRGNGFGIVADAIDVARDPGSFLGLGAEINRGNWLFIAEATWVEADRTYLTDQEAVLRHRRPPLRHLDPHPYLRPPQGRSEDRNRRPHPRRGAARAAARRGRPGGALRQPRCRLPQLRPALGPLEQRGAQGRFHQVREQGPGRRGQRIRCARARCRVHLLTGGRP
ncbi:MAG: hypothetical protein KatS3mg127_0962 [Silanimonas sp.]|nr:MAG: hypothetical protein KatS3mg127_0962 [Silanimonas sp.]